MADRDGGAVEVDGVTVRYHIRGAGATVVFVHGVYVGGTLWEGIAERLEGFRCVVATWPLGAHADPAPGADLSARAALDASPLSSRSSTSMM